MTETPKQKQQRIAKAQAARVPVDSQGQADRQAQDVPLRR